MIIFGFATVHFWVNFLYVPQFSQIFAIPLQISNLTTCPKKENDIFFKIAWTQKFPLNSEKTYKKTASTNQNENKKLWLHLQAAGTICDIVVADGLSEPLTLSEVLFGDVWLCSGQSNMERAMSSIVNSTEEIAASAPYDQIRFMIAARVTSVEVEMEDNTPALGWSRPAQVKFDGGFGKWNAHFWFIVTTLFRENVAALHTHTNLHSSLEKIA